MDIAQPGFRLLMDYGICDLAILVTVGLAVCSGVERRYGHSIICTREEQYMNHTAQLFNLTLPNL